MLKKIKIYLSWMMSVLLCFNNSFAVIQAEENTQNQEYENQEAAEDQPIEEGSDISEISDEESANSDEIEQDNEEASDEELNLQETTEETVIDESEPYEEETDDPAEIGTEMSSVFETFADYTYTVDNEQVTITKYTGSDTVLTVPGQIEGMQVAVIGSKAFSGCTDLVKVELPEGLTTIYAYAFENCTSLEEVKLPDSITTMGYRVFGNDTSLTTVNYPGSYTTSVGGNGANSNQYGQLFYGCTSLDTVSIPEGTEVIAAHAFRGSSVSRIDIPASATVIGDHAFVDCKNLADVDLKEGLTTIYAYAFGNCTSLEEIELPDSITTMGYRVFENDTSLTTINYPRSYTTSVGGNGANSNQYGQLFYGCTSLDTVSIPDGITEIATHVFYNSSINNITIPQTITNIGSYVFAQCQNLSEIDIPASVTVISDHLFSGCINLKEIDLKDGLTTIYAYAFEGCTSLEEIKLPDSITTMGYRVFGNDTSLTTVNYPRSYTTSVGGNGANSNQYGQLFYGCTSLDRISIPDGITSIAAHVFRGSSISYIDIPNSVKEIKAYSFAECGGLEELEIPEGVLTLEEYAFYNSTVLKKVILPDSVTTIGKNAFSGCTNLSVWNYPSSLSSAGTGIFENDAFLKVMTVPEGVKDLPENVFNGANELVRINLPESLETIGSNAFTRAVSLKKVILPSLVNKINTYAFANMTGLTDIWIDENVTSIGNNAFRGCTNVTIHGIAGSYAQTYAVNNNIPFSEDPVIYDETKLYGHVLDGEGNGVSGITVSVYDIASAVVLGEYLTDENGCWAYDLGNPGDAYSITAYHSEYDILPTEIKVNVSDEAEMDVGDFTAVLSGQSSPAELFTCAKLNGGYLSITGYIGEETAVVIPEKIDGSKVTVIAEDAFAGNEVITTVRIPDTVTQIGKNAFQNCTALENVRFSGRLISVGESAFDGCASLKKAELPNTVVTISQYAFRNCTELTEVNYPLSLMTAGTGIFTNDVKLEVFTVPENVKSIPNNMFKDASGLKHIIFPQTLISIGASAFMNCTGLTEVELPDSVQSIGNNAFKGCTELSALNYPLSLTSAGTAIFTDDTKLVQIIVPEGVIVLPQNVFREANCLQKALLPTSLEEIGNYAFNNCENLTEVNIPDAIKKIGAYAFNNCSSLAEVNVPDSVSEIGNYAFQNCTRLSEFNYPSSLVTAGTGIFNGDTGIVMMTVPEGVEALPDNVFSGDMKTAFFELPSTLLTIGKKAFAGEKELSRLVLPDSVTAINDQAFQNCTSLTDIWIGENVMTISSNAFDGCSTDTLVIHGIAGSQAQAFAQEKGFTFSEERFSDKPRTLQGLVICDNAEDSEGASLMSDEREGLADITIEIVDGQTKEVVARPKTDNFGVWQYNYAKAGMEYVIVTAQSEMYTDQMPVTVTVGEDEVTDAGTIHGTKITAVKDDRYVQFGWAPTGYVWNDDPEYEVLQNTEFSEDGIAVINGIRYMKDGSDYKKMAPIIWRVLSENSDLTYTLISATTMATKAFNTLSNANIECNWTNSVIRDYLNGDFLKCSFTEEERKDIKDRLLSSLKPGLLPLDRYTYSYDQVYILSSEEYGASRFGFSHPSKKDLRRAATHEIYETDDVTTPAYGDISTDGKRWFSWTRDVPFAPYGLPAPAYVTCDGEITNADGTILDSAHVYCTWRLALRPVINVRKHSEYLQDYYYSDPDVSEYNGPFTFYSGDDISSEICHYSDTYFENSGFVYNHELSKMSLALEMSAFNSKAGNFFDVSESYYNDAFDMTTKIYNDQTAELDFSKARNVYELMKRCGFKDIGVNDDYLISTRYDGDRNDGNNIGICIGRKEINGETLLAVAVRGANYGDEWIGDFEVYESQKNHRGFEIARDRAYRDLIDYVTMYDITGDIKFWIVGYSRGAAVANMLSAHVIDNGIADCTVAPENMFAYTFETPMGTKNSDARESIYDGIWNIVNPIDFVPMVAFSDWGYTRYGNDVFLPSKYSNSKQYYAYESKVLEKVNDVLAEKKYKNESALDYVVNTCLLQFPFDHLPMIENQHSELNKLINAITIVVIDESDDLTYDVQHDLQAIFKSDTFEIAPLTTVITGFITILAGLSWTAIRKPKLLVEHGPQLVHDAYCIAFAHFPELQYAWLNSIPSDMVTSDGFIRWGIINSTADIAVYDDHNSLQLSVVDNEIIYEEDSCIEASIDSDGQKIIYVPSDVSVHVEMIGTDSGTLNYSVQEFSLAENKVTKEKNYYDLPLEKGTQYTATMSDITDRQYNIYDENNNQITTYEELNGSEIEQYQVTVTAEGNGTVSGTSYKLKGEFTEAVAEPDENATFIGWYDSNGNLVSNESYYRFRVTGNAALIGRFETPLVSVDFADEEIILVKGESQELKPVLTPYNGDVVSMQWESSDPDYVTVDSNGVLKGIEEGSSTITLNVNNGKFIIQCLATVVSDGIYIKNLKAPYIYTGSAIKPEISVYDSGTLLRLKTDYTTTYKNTTKAYHVEDSENPTATDKKKAPQIIIKSNSKGNYKGTKIVYFSIDPLDLNDEQITVDELSAQAGSKPVSPVPVVYFNGKKMKNKTDYTVDYNGWDQLTPGDVAIKIHGKGNFQGTRDVTVHVASSDLISVAKLNVTSQTLKYADLNGDNFIEEIASAVTVKNGKKAVPTDAYYVEDIPEDYKKTGTVKFTLVGNEAAGFYGKKTVTVKITGIALTDKKIKATVPSYEYTGEPQTLGNDFSIKYSEELLEAEKDYSVESYSNNVNAGTATVVLKGLGNYTGIRKVTFKITPVDASGKEIHVDDAYYTKGGSKPKVTVEGMIEGTDYTVKYANNKAVTIPNTSKLPTVTVTFKGNYKGTVTRDFFIEPKPLSAVTITSKDKVYSAKANAWKSAPVLKDTDGKTLKAGTDYEKTITYTTVDGDELPAVVEADTLVKVTVTGKGNYTGTAETFYRILETGKDISKLTFKIANKEYTGSPVTLNDNDILSIKSGKNELDLKLGTDYEIVSYTNNVKKGTAKVTFRGKGDYGGEKTVSFKIGQRSFVEYWQGVKNFFSGLF